MSEDNPFFPEVIVLDHIHNPVVKVIYQDQELEWESTAFPKPEGWHMSHLRATQASPSSPHEVATVR